MGSSINLNRYFCNKNIEKEAIIDHNSLKILISERREKRGRY